MSFNLRPYQQQAVDAATNWMRQRIEPAVLELSTGAGKSFILAAIAHWIYQQSGKKVLCLQPSAELLQQNHEKYQLTGERAGVFSASAGGRDMRWPVIYGTPGTVKNSLDMFGGQFAAVAIDEAHGVTPTVRAIIDGMRRHNANLRVMGMTATPYRMGTGYIYQYDDDGKWVEQAVEPYFNTLLYRITARELIDMGFLTPPTTTPIAQAYNAGGLLLNSRGQFDAADVERVFEGQGRLTSEIVADVVQHSVGRSGVMLFAATVQHAKEIMASLPPDNSRMLGGDINSTRRERARIIKDFKEKRFKYLVSVGMLTTGFDAPHVDVVAVLRKTESPGLFQQIIGRGSRLYEGKENCIASGQMVLTNNGLKPIEDVELRDKLWDGLEWVSHDGVVFKGVKDVITYQGLTATPDHKCWTKEGWKTLWELQQSGESLTTTGYGRVAIKLTDCCERRNNKKREGEASVYDDAMHGVRHRGGEGVTKYKKESRRVQKMRPKEKLIKTCSRCPEMADIEMYKRETKMHEPKRQSVGKLWRKGDKVSIQEPVGYGKVDNGQCARLEQGKTNRQDKQRRALRAGKYKDGVCFGEHEQSEMVERNQKGPRIHVEASRGEVCGIDNSEEIQLWNVGRRGVKRLEHPIKQTKRGVWDIINAGPRNRFTCQGKLVSNCLVLDYAGNIEFHGLQDDLFEPEIRTRLPSDGELEPMRAVCPECEYENMFKPRPNEAGLQHDRHGYLVDLHGNRIETEHGPEPAHFGRRCTGQVDIGGGRLARCEYRWTFKECPECHHENDIAARFCESCKEELVDPNTKLQREFKRIKEDPYEISTDEVLEWSAHPHVGRSGKTSVKCTIKTPWRTFSVWYMPTIGHEWAMLNKAVYKGHIAPSVDVFLQYLDSHGTPPETVTYHRIRGSRFYKVLAYNRRADEVPRLD